MAKDDDTRAALERELEGYERMGDTDRAKQVRDAIASLGGKGRRSVTEHAVDAPPENAAARTGGLATDDLGALANKPARPRERGKK